MSECDLRERAWIPRLTEYGKLLQDGQLEMNDIVLVHLKHPSHHRSASSSIHHSQTHHLHPPTETHPILCCTPHKCVLRSTCCRITFDGVSSSSNKIEQSREFDNESIVVVLYGAEVENLASESPG
jgi:hypothetical protein